jgi:hypothetical protein
MMLVQTRQPVRLKAFGPSFPTIRRPSGLGNLVGRLIQVTLALYLLPVLIVVMLASGVGMGVLAVSKLFTTPVHRSVS